VQRTYIPAQFSRMVLIGSSAKTMAASRRALHDHDGDLQVIGAGMGRTGTLSLKKALEILYDSPCYHMVEVYVNGEQEFWTKALTGNASDEEYRKTLKRYSASVDFPSAACWEDLARVYPDAKIILTLRSPDSWFQSCSETIFNAGAYSRWWGIRVFSSIFNRKHTKQQIAMYAKFTGDPNFVVSGGLYDKERCVRAFEQWNEEVLKRCPKDRLLVFEAKQGWEPLCKFLGKPIPDVPFPNENDSAQLKAAFLETNRIGWILSILFFPLAIVAAFVFPVTL
jgi:Sulfotransferase domain